MHSNCALPLALLVVFIHAAAEGASFYVDASAGDDANAGTSTAAPWKSLAKVSAGTFAPGDRIYFKAGETWFGELDLNGNGTAAAPIVVDQYGIGNKPVINGNGYESAVRLQGVSYWEVNNLEIINNGGPTLSGAADYRVGVLVKSAFSAVRRHIYLRNLEVHHTFPETGPYGHGIHVISQGSTSVNTYYDDVRIENCRISLTGRFGVWVQHTGTSNEGYKYNLNTIIRSNLFLNTGGSGAETGWCDGVLLENNVVHHSGASVDPRQWARGSGYWPWRCRNVLVQFNEFRHARGEADSCGVHIDYGNRDVIIQYNLSLDNEGGFVEILGDCINATYRYNVSIKDGSRVKGVNGASQDGMLIWLSDYVGDAVPGIGSINCRVYNNTVYVRPGITNYLRIMKGTQNASIQNNVFYVAGKSIYSNAGTNTNFENNLWYGNLPAGVPLSAGCLQANPLLLRPGGTNAADCLLSPVSPAIAAGLPLPDSGSRDFFGNALGEGPRSLGAHERAFSDSGVISVNLADYTSQEIGAGTAYGIASQNSVAAGWVNLNRTLNSSSLPFADGFPSSVRMLGSAPAGWGSANAAYAGTPLSGGINDYTGTTSPTSVTLSNLSATFPRGYKVIAYLSGYIANTGASISDGKSTFYYQPLKTPSTEFSGILTRTTTTNDPGPGNAPLAQYAVFGEPELLTNDTFRLTLRALSGGGVILGGLQILSTGQLSQRGVPYGWYSTWNLPVDDDSDSDSDSQSAWQEYFAGTIPTNPASLFRITGIYRDGNSIGVSWSGGTGGSPLNWSIYASTNSRDWSVLADRSIPRNPAGSNTWIHSNAILSGPNLLYRPGVDYNR